MGDGTGVERQSVKLVLVDIGVNECLCLLMRAGERRFTPGSTATRLLANLYSKERRASALRCSNDLQFGTFNISVTLAVCSNVLFPHEC